MGTALYACDSFGLADDAKHSCERKVALMISSKRFLAVAAASVLFALVATAATAASLKSQLIGAWTLVSEANTSNGNEPFGPHPVGIAIYDRSGHFSTQRMRADLPKFAANSKNGGTDAENKAVVQGIMSIFGTYTVDEKMRVRILRIVGSSYPNLDGTDIRESVVITGDLMTVTNPIATLVWRRAK
jgi:lipocalin-like protein